MSQPKDIKDIVNSIEYTFSQINRRYIRTKITLSKVELGSGSYFSIAFGDIQDYPLMRFLRKEKAEITNMEIKIKDGQIGDITDLDIEDNIISMVGEENKLLILFTKDYIPLSIKDRLSVVYDELGILILLLREEEVLKLHDWATQMAFDDCLARLCDLAKKVMARKILKNPLESVVSDLEERLTRQQRLEGQQLRTVESKKKFIEAFDKTCGNVTISCKFAEVKSRKTYYNWLETDSDFKKALDLTLSMRKDYVEDLCMAKMQKGEGSMIRFFLSRRHPDYFKKRTSKPPKRKTDPWRKWEKMPDEDEK